nr:MAG TPA: hypothetical protein [Caudoviricetes sp.]
MPWIAFVDNELYEKINRISDNKEDSSEEYPEQEFIASCLRIGLTIEDLKEITYIEAMKILYSTIEKKKVKKVRKATQADWDRLM